MTHTPEFVAALNAVALACAFGYGAGLAFVTLILTIGKSRGGE